MRAFMVVLALVWTVLLASIALDLRDLNRSLGWLRLPTGASSTALATETREQRRERYRREAQERYERLIDQLDAAQAINAQGATSKPGPARK